MTTTTQPKRKCIDGGTCHHECQPSECFREECCAPFSDSGLDDNWKPIAALPLPVMPEQAEPVAYQSRFKTERLDIWYPWEDCHKASYEEYLARPKFGSLTYETRPLFAQDPSALLARIAHLEQEEECSEDVIKKFSTILADICLTLKGERTDGVHHSYHDLGELVTVLKLENELHKVKVAELEAENQNLKEGLKYYADGHHFTKTDEDAWDTVSGEPVNFYEDENSTAIIEDGSIAKQVLAGNYKVLEDDET